MAFTHYIYAVANNGKAPTGLLDWGEATPAKRRVQIHNLNKTGEFVRKLPEGFDIKDLKTLRSYLIYSGDLREEGQ